MKFTERLFWFVRNLIAFLLQLITCPFYLTWGMIYSIYGMLMILTVTDGSEEICFPWELNWKEPF